MSLTLYFDEDYARRALIGALRLRGVGLVTASEAGNRGLSDDDHLAFARTTGRVLVSANVGDFMALHSRWIALGRSHAGIILLHQQTLGVGEIARRLTLLASIASPEDLVNRYEFLSDWE